LTISHNIESTSYCSRLHNVKTKRGKRTAKKSVKVQAVLEDDTLIISPYTLEFITITRSRYKQHCQIPPNAALIAVTKLDKRTFITILVLSSRATLNGIHSSLFATHNERLLYQWISLIRIVTQTYCDQNTAKISIVHTINNWHASCTRNFKDPLASTYSSFT